MEVLDDHEHKDTLVISPEIRAYLYETAKWAKFLAILGFIGIGIIALVVLFIGSISNSLTETPSSLRLQTIPLLVIGVLYFFPISFLFKFATSLKKSIELEEQPALSIAFKNLKSLYRYMGILAIATFILYVLLFSIGFLSGDLLNN